MNNKKKVSFYLKNKLLMQCFICKLDLIVQAVYLIKHNCESNINQTIFEIKRANTYL